MLGAMCLGQEPGTEALVDRSLAIKTSNKDKPELMRKAEVYWLDIVGLSSTQGLGTRNLSHGEGLDSVSVWSCPWRDVACGVGILVSPRFSVCTLGFPPVNWAYVLNDS